MTSDHYTIKDLERLSGVRAHTIRTWEQRYGIFTPGRTATNLRRYSSADLKNLINISLLNRSGYKISRLSSMTTAEREQLSAELLSVSDQLGGHDRELLFAMLEMDEMRFHSTFDALCLQSGFEQVIISVIFPFFEKIGQLWQSGTVDPAQEHFFSNLIRSKLISETAKLQGCETRREKILLFLPGEESHELGLLFYNYVFKLHGYHTYYLGAAVPQASVDRAVGLCKPDVIVTGLSTALAIPDLRAFVADLCESAPDAKIFFTGPLLTSALQDAPPNAFQTKDLIGFLKINPVN
ncbi:MerR family transcriptional regulator [Pedobacter sp. SYP-B3415]|uniref:MerR family transcriptional regulator n=1 Tax=Pedobacter sp. SYP-B3415 TaxID=2496641 RepID=UPI00101D4C56|nr:MerR family transcriptional regulator [Pedobacter sp. SYP-B3415]